MGLEESRTGGVLDLGTIGVAKIYARVTQLLWIGISTGNSSSGMAVWTLSSSWGGEGVWVRALPVFSSFGVAGTSVGAGSAIVTLRSAGVKGGKELLQYLPSSQRASSERDKIYPLQRTSMYRSNGFLRVMAFPAAWKFRYMGE